MENKYQDKVTYFRALIIRGRNLPEFIQMKQEDKIEQLARDCQFELGFDLEQFVKDVDMPEIWYSHAYGVICDFNI